MPGINEYICSECGFSLPTGWGGVMYVLDDEGKRIACPHPGETATVAHVLGKSSSLPEELRKEVERSGGELTYDLYLKWQSDPEVMRFVNSRTGDNSDCVCRDCLHQFTADLDDETVKARRAEMDKRALMDWLPAHGYDPRSKASLAEAVKRLPRLKLFLERKFGYGGAPKDERKCPACGSANVRTALELVGEPCAKCREGVIHEVWTGRIS